MAVTTPATPPIEQTAYVTPTDRPVPVFYLWVRSVADWYTAASAQLAAIAAWFAGTSGAWTDYTPTATPAANTITALTTAGRWYQVGKLVYVHFTISITTNGTGSGNFIAVSLPVAAQAALGHCGSGKDGLTNKQLSVKVTASTTCQVAFSTTAFYPGANGAVLDCSLVYEAA